MDIDLVQLAVVIWTCSLKLSGKEQASHSKGK